jgi:gluconate kinase
MQESEREREREREKERERERAKHFMEIDMIKLREFLESPT